MGEVLMEYRYSIVAGRGGSSCQTLADTAHQKAKEFFGEQKFTTHVEVSGKKDEYYVQCVARADMKVDQ